MALRAGAGAAAALVLGGGVAFALHSSPTAAASPDPSQPPVTSTDPSISPAGGASITAQQSGSPDSSPRASLRAGQDVLVLGDSLGLDVYAWLADLLPDRYVSYAAVVGRNTPDTLTALRQLNPADVPPVVLISLGTNDLDAASFRSAAESILATLGPNRCVVWSDIVRPESFGEGNAPINDAIAELARAHPNVHVFHWSALVAQHPDWIAGDGIHPGEQGAQARAQGFADAALTCSPLNASAPTASKEYLPPSAFTLPGGTTIQGGQVGPSPTPAPSRSTTATPQPTSSPSRSSAGPSRTPSPSVTAPKSSPPPPSSSAPASPSATETSTSSPTTTP